jgi:hypothetical protein
MRDAIAQSSQKIGKYPILSVDAMAGGIATIPAGT